ncbi:uncharacterized protein LOC113500376 isoform X1 [Trichoplusia ni]|uniref:Odorant receptor n=1 Tax=Trichoplusia ni TaxID=7111 RepID=A0A7E5W9S9_TRINI|nr:uncharacterized protein LOC113500376 isoform X1 [Trichoplusia ni]
MLRGLLDTINAWPVQKEGSRYIGLLNYMLLLFFIVCWINIFLLVKVNFDKLSFYELGHTYIVLFMTIVNISRTIITLPGDTKYREVGSLFFDKMHLFYYKAVSKFASQTHERIHFICHYFTLFICGQMTIGLILFNVIPMWINYAAGNFDHKVINSTYEHSVYFYLPEYAYTHWDAYIAICLVNWFISYVTSVILCMLDLLLSLMIFHLWGHFKILIHDLESFPLPAKTETVTFEGNNVLTAAMYSDEEQEQVSKKLKECIDYHRLITNYTDRMSEAFGPMLFISYLFHQVAGCLLLLECSQMTPEALIRYAPLSLILYQQLIQLSVIFELIGSTYTGREREANMGGLHSLEV